MVSKNALGDKETIISTGSMSLLKCSTVNLTEL